MSNTAKEIALRAGFTEEHINEVFGSPLPMTPPLPLELACEADGCRYEAKFMIYMDKLDAFGYEVCERHARGFSQRQEIS